MRSTVCRTTQMYVQYVLSKKENELLNIYTLQQFMLNDFIERQFLRHPTETYVIFYYLQLLQRLFVMLG